MVTEKIRAAAKKAASALSGKAGVLNTLEGEHAEIASLLRKILTASSTAKAAEDHYPTLRRRLLLHLRAEQEVVYPACEARPATAALIVGSREQHAAIEQVVQELDLAPADTAEWKEQLRRLHELFHAHVDEEENVLFVQCEEAFERRELRQLDRTYEDARQRHEQAMIDVSVKRSEPARPHAPGPY